MASWAQVVAFGSRYSWINLTCLKCSIFEVSVREFLLCWKTVNWLWLSWRAFPKFFGLMGVCLGPLSTFRTGAFSSQSCKHLAKEGKFLSRFFAQGPSYFEHQMHGLVSQFHKKCIPDSKYQIFGCRVFTGRFQVKDSMAFQWQYWHNHKYVEVLLQYRNRQSWYRPWTKGKYFGSWDPCGESFYRGHNS